MNLRPIVISAGAGAGIILAALGLKAAEHAQLVPAAIGDRTFQVMIGLGLAFYGNFIPKRIGAVRSAVAAGRRQTMLRVSGWAFTLAGLAYAALTVALPVPLGATLGMAAIASALAVTVVFSLVCVAGWSRTSKGTAA